MQDPSTIETGIPTPPQVNARTQFHIHDFRFEVVFREIKSLLEKNGIGLILLKGPHLAHAFYNDPHERPYADLDILVRPKDFLRAAGILETNRYNLIEEDENNLATTAQTNHWAFHSRFGLLIELHRGFTGLERHPVKLDKWFHRAVDFQYGETPAKGLAAEDLLCHLCLHIGKSFFYLIEKKHIRDLDVVIRKKDVDWNAFFARCHETRLKAIAYYCLWAAMAQYGTPVPGDVISRLHPGRWRQKWLDRHLKVSVFPIYRFHSRGVVHARKKLTLPLLDGGWSWVRFGLRAIGVKGLDIVLRVPLFGKGWKKWQKGRVLGDG